MMLLNRLGPTLFELLIDKYQIRYYEYSCKIVFPAYSLASFI